jgi:hypothetical protein
MGWIFGSRPPATRTVLMLLVVVCVVQSAMIWWPQFLGPARGFVSVLCFGLALIFGIPSVFARARQ